MMGVGMGLGIGQTLGEMVGDAIQQSGIARQSKSGLQVPPPPPLSYYVAQNGATTGPFDRDTLNQMVISSTLTANTYVFKVGGTQWVKAATDPEIMQLLSAIIPPPPPPPVD
jgi:hypothetical protein